jgi:hypothetical protein
MGAPSRGTAESDCCPESKERRRKERRRKKEDTQEKKEDTHATSRERRHPRFINWPKSRGSKKPWMSFSCLACFPRPQLI